jgi:hypothetical protein
MNFNDLYKKIAQLDEGLSECSMEGCGMDTAGATKQQDNVSMNVTMNGSGSNGIKDLIDILRNIEQASSDNNDGDELFGEPNTDSHAEPIIGDSFENSVEGGSDTTTLDISSVTPTGNDLASKGKEAPKQAGGGNPWNVNESSIAAKLAKHYEEVKSRNNVTEGYWGWDPPDDDPEINAYGIERDIEDVEIDLPQELHSTFPSNFFSFTYEFDHNGDLELHKILTYSEESDDMVDVTKYKDVLMNPIWSWIEKNDLDNYEQDYIAHHSDDGYRVDPSYDQRAAAQDAENRWERGRDSRY